MFYKTNFYKYLNLFFKSVYSQSFYPLEFVIRNFYIFIIIIAALYVNLSFLKFEESYLARYLFISLPLGTLWLNVAFSIQQKVVDGSISNYLIKPYDFYKVMFIKEFSFGFLRIIASFILLFFVFSVNGLIKYLNLIFLIRSLLALSVSFYMIYLINEFTSYLTFIFEKSSSLLNLFDKLLAFLGGGILIADAISEKLKYLPFYYFIGFETNFILGKVAKIEIILFFIYLLLLLALTKKIKKIAIKKLEINGG